MVYCLVSKEVITGVIPTRRMEEFIKDKLENPTVGKTGPMALVSGWETIITYVFTPTLCMRGVSNQHFVQYNLRIVIDCLALSKIFYGEVKHGYYRFRGPNSKPK